MTVKKEVGQRNVRPFFFLYVTKLYFSTNCPEGFQGAFVACQVAALPGDEQGTGPLFPLVFFILDIDADHPAAVEGAGCLEDGVAHDDAAHAVVVQQELEGVGGHRGVFGIGAHQAAVPDGTPAAVEEGGERVVFLPGFGGQEEDAAHGFVDLLQGESAAVELGAQTGVHVEVAADDLHGVAGGEPAAQLGVRAQQVGIGQVQGVGQLEVTLFGIAQVVGQHHGLVVAQQHGDVSACPGGFGFELIEQPADGDDVLAAVEDVTDDHEVVGAVAPVEGGIDDAVGLQQADEAVHPPVGVGEDEGLVGGCIAAGGPADGMQLHAEGVTAAVVGDLEGERRGQLCVNGVGEGAAGIDPDETGAAVGPVEQVGAVGGPFTAGGCGGGAGRSSPGV